MTKFTDSDIKLIRGNYSKIADMAGCTPQYATGVIKGRVSRETTMTKFIIELAEKLLLNLRIKETCS